MREMLVQSEGNGVPHEETPNDDQPCPSNVRFGGVRSGIFSSPEPEKKNRANLL